MPRQEVVTSFLQHKGLILLLRRSSQAGSFQGQWAGVSGYLPHGVLPLAHARQEIREETGLDASEVELLRQGEPLLVVDEGGGQWMVHPFLFRITDPDRVRLDWEHSEARWVAPESLSEFESVPGLKAVWEQLWKR